VLRPIAFDAIVPSPAVAFTVTATAVAAEAGAAPANGRAAAARVSVRAVRLRNGMGISLHEDVSRAVRPWMQAHSRR
jgi:hypothetical protein